jgi:TPR repeat protein
MAAALPVDRNIRKTNGLPRRRSTSAARRGRNEIGKVKRVIRDAENRGESRVAGKGRGRPRKNEPTNPRCAAVRSEPTSEYSKTAAETRHRVTGQDQYEEALRLARRADEVGGPLPVALLQEAAAAGYAPALYALANWRLHGKGVHKSYTLAVSLLKKSAAKRYAPAEYDLAVAYETGKGTPKNVRAALIYYRRAANDGDLDAQTEVARCYYYGVGAARNLRKSVEWYQKAAERGDSEAQYAVARAYERGEGAERSVPKALHWYGKAAAQGDEDAKKAIADLAGRTRKAVS